MANLGARLNNFIEPKQKAKRNKPSATHKAEAKAEPKNKPVTNNYLEKDSDENDSREIEFSEISPPKQRETHKAQKNTSNEHTNMSASLLKDPRVQID